MQDNINQRNLAPRNKKGQRHGYWEFYNADGRLWYKGMYINDIDLGFWIETRIKQIYYAR
jgi:hypothetical protein